MKMLRYMVGVLVVGMVLSLSSSVVEAALFFDDFNGDNGTLLGETANTGQTWTLQPGNPHPSLDTGTALGQGGTVGAGIDDSGTAGDTFRRNTALIGSTMSSGLYVLSFDVTRGSATGPRPSAGLLEGGGAGPGEFQIAWDGNNLKTYATRWQGLNHNIGVNVGTLHLEVAFDLTPGGPNTAEVTYSGAANGAFTLPNNPGGTVALDAMLVTIYSGNNVSGIIGYDNLNLSLVPEPGTLTIALGMLVAGISRRRWLVVQRHLVDEKCRK